MKVLILTEGGRSIGFGHLTRCLSICQALEERGIFPEFVVNGDDSVYAPLAGRRFTVFNWLEKKDELFGLASGADAAVVDSYLAGREFYEKISRLVRTPVYIDDNKRIEYPAGIVVNGTVFAEEMGYPDAEGISYRLGAEYMPLRKEFCEASEKEIKDVIGCIMVTFGGDDHAGMTPRILRLLAENYPGVKKKAVIGRSFSNVAEIEGAVDANTELMRFPDAGGMKKVMEEADVAVSAGGQTLYEFARMGVPTVAVATEENQLNNVKGLKRAGFIEYAGWRGDAGLDASIPSCIARLKGKAERQKRSSIGRSIIDGRGSFRIAGFILGQSQGV